MKQFIAITVITMVDLEDIVEELKDKPFLLFYLYNKYLTGDDTRLPKFISRKKVVIDLIKLGLIEFINPTKLHFKETKFTDLGIEVYLKMESEGIFTVFHDISLYSRNAFITRYESKLNLLKDTIKYPQSVFYKIILKNIGDFNKWNRNGNVDYRVTEIKLIEKDEEFEILRIFYEFYCIICQKNITQSIELKFSFDDDDNLPFQIKCNECKSIFRICKKFQCFISL